MRKFILILLALVAGATTPVLAQEQEQPTRSKTREAAAAQGLALLRALAANQPRETGLTSADAARATLGTPLPVMNVDFRALSNFKSGDDAAALLKPSAAAFYPVLLDGGVRSGVRVENAAAGWEAARVGNSGLATALDRARRALPSPDDPSVTLVQVLPLNLVFVGQKDASGWLLAPVTDDTSVELQTGKAEPAARVFMRLAPLAQRHNGEPT